MTICIQDRSEKQNCQMADPLQGPPPASMPEVRGDNGEEGDGSDEDGWTASEMEDQLVR